MSSNLHISVYIFHLRCLTVLACSRLTTHTVVSSASPQVFIQSLPRREKKKYRNKNRVNSCTNNKNNYGRYSKNITEKNNDNNNNKRKPINKIKTNHNKNKICEDVQKNVTNYELFYLLFRSFLQLPHSDPPNEKKQFPLLYHYSSYRTNRQ